MNRACAVGLLVMVALVPLAAEVPTGFALLDRAAAEALATRSATRHTRAVLIQASAKAGAEPKPAAWIDGGAESMTALGELSRLPDLALAWRLGWNATTPQAAAQAARFRDAALRWQAAWVRQCRVGFHAFNESRLEALILSWDLVEGAADANLRRDMALWLRRVAEGFLEDRPGQPKAADGTAWQSHRVKLAALAAFSLGDAGLIARAEEAFGRQIARNLGGDGVPRDFRDHDAVAWAVYDLQPLATAALAAARHGRDWYRWQPDGRASLEKALLWLADYATGRVVHREFAASPVEAERKAAAAGTGGLGQPWNPVGAGQLFWTAVRLDVRWLSLAARLDQDRPWLAVTLPTPEPPARTAQAAASPAPSGTTGGAGSLAGSVASAGSGGQSPKQAQAAINQAQLSSLLQALRGGAAAGTGTTGTTAAGGAGVDSVLSLWDALGGGSSGTNTTE